MKISMLHLLIMFAFVIPANASDKVNGVPSDQLSRIEIQAPSGWDITFHSDGSAKLNYGANPMDFAVAPKGSFSMKTIYDHIFPLLTTEHKRGSYNIFLLQPGQHFLTAVYINDNPTIKKLVSDVQDKAVPFDKNRFVELVKKAPIVPSESGS